MTLVPLGDLKLAARQVLAREFVPMHYAVLARRAVADLGTEVADAALRDVAEDLREKALQAGAFGMGYLRRPFCLGYLSEWFAGPTLLNVEAVRIDITDDLATRASQETALRYPFIENKYGRTPEAHARAIASGLLTEFAVREWFKAQFPALYREPANAGQYSQPCDHDFRLALPSCGVLRVDVAGPGRDGEFGTARRKPSADLHVIARSEGLTVVISGVMRGTLFRRGPFVTEETQPLSRLRVMLNCETSQHSWFELSRAIRQGGLPSMRDPRG